VYAVSLLERRLHVLLDQHRYDLVEAEARRTGLSVAAVIREAIDLRLDSVRLETESDRRAEAGRRLLATAEEDDLPEPSWDERLADQEADLDEMLR